MKAVFVIWSGMPHHVLAAAGVAAGLARHGIEVVTRPEKDCTVELVGADFAICWGWRIGRKLAPVLPVMVLERGYIGDRMSWTSIGWNGLNGNALFPQWTPTPAAVKRRDLMRHHMKPWRVRSGGPTVIMGQVRGDAALESCPDYVGWLDRTARELSMLGPVAFRAHPSDLSIPTPKHAERLHGSLADALAIANHVVTWNSNSAVDAVLAGVPCIVMDRGSMAWPVSHHGGSSQITPDREWWFAHLTMAQWSPEEIARGEFWPWHRDLLRSLSPELAPALDAAHV
jgi:hypothetical protein